MMMQEITSSTNPFIKHLVKLREDKSYRQRCQRLVVSGSKLIRELAAHQSFFSVLVQNDTPLDPQIRAGQLFSVPAAILKKVTGLESPEPIAAEIAMPLFGDVASAPLLLVLDGIADPGNLGTLLRTALALGWDAVFITEGSVDPFNEKALRAAKGATFRLPLALGSDQELRALLAGRQGSCLTADAKGKEIVTLSLSTPLTLILGNEAHGPASHFKHTSELASVKMQGNMESLNVAVAGAVLMDQIKRGLP